MDLRNCPRVRYYLSGRQGDELNNGAMAQLVARFHGMEEVGGSNPPSSTENPVLDQRAPVFYCLRRVFVGRVSWTGLSGYRTLRVAGGVTFRRVGAGKSVF